MRFLRNRKGQGMSEYLIILALVAIATIGAVIFFADNVKNQIANVTNEIAGNDATPAVEGDETTARQSRGMSDYTEAASPTGSP